MELPSLSPVVLALALASAAPLVAPAAAQARQPRGEPRGQAEAAPAAAQVNVAVGPVLAAKRERYGSDQLSYLSTELAETVRRAAARGGFSRIDLVLEDAEPNRPTAAMLGRLPELSPFSISLGGARITGTAYRGGQALPLKSSWYESDLRNELPGGVWPDAERAFQFLAGDLSHGRVPTRYSPGTPAGDAPSPDLRDRWGR